MTTAVAISTTGHLHRMHLLAQAVNAWGAVLTEPDDELFVTVDGSPEEADRVRARIAPWRAVEVLRVGQAALNATMHPDTWYAPEMGERLGVAANKNTGLEAMMATDADRLWLSDDDTWPLSPASLVAHYNLAMPHSMVNWGQHRHKSRDVMGDDGRGYSSWNWPRGAVLYAERSVIETVGGMVEAFGTGGHEHVEWSRRIHEAGLTPVAYPSPLSYSGDRNMGARSLWHAEDMSRPHEGVAPFVSRRRALTTIRRDPLTQTKQDLLMDSMFGSGMFIPYAATENGRVPATLTRNV